MKKLGLLPRLILGIILGIVIGNLNLPSIVRILATFNSIFGNFLGFTIPLIIVGFIIPGIADLGKSAGKLLGVTTLIAYCSTVIAGCLAFFTNHALLSHIISPDMARDLANPEKGLLHPFFTIDMPPLMGVMSALLIAFILGVLALPSARMTCCERDPTNSSASLKNSLPASSFRFCRFTSAGSLRI